MSSIEMKAINHLNFETRVWKEEDEVALFSFECLEEDGRHGKIKNRPINSRAAAADDDDELMIQGSCWFN